MVALSAELRESEPEALPAPSAVLVLIRVLVQSYLATCGRRRAEAFLRYASELLADEESITQLLPLRPASQHAEVTKARREAVALFRRYVPAFIAAMPRE